MTYRGQIKNGVVVFDGKPPLKEGTVVRVEAEPEPQKECAPDTAEVAVKHEESQGEEWDRLLREMEEEEQVQMDAVQELWRRRTSKK